MKKKIHKPVFGNIEITVLFILVILEFFHRILEWVKALDMNQLRSSPEV